MYLPSNCLSKYLVQYSNVPNKPACTFISGKVCLLTLIEPKRQTFLEINVHAGLCGTLEYMMPVCTTLTKFTVIKRL